MSWYRYSYFQPGKSVSQRSSEARQHIAREKTKGRPLSPVVIAGRKIATSFWGQAWCNNLESYRDFAYRLDRSRSYVRSGSVVDLTVTDSTVRAQVLGTRMYTVTVKVDPLPGARWEEFKNRCAGSLTSLLDLLRGKLPESILQMIVSHEDGLFPAPRNIHFDCTCPDIASMCKHVAAALYGVGARLDSSPELFFVLLGVNPGELFTSAASAIAAAPAPEADHLGPSADLEAIFGIDLGLNSPGLVQKADPPRPEPIASARAPAASASPAGHPKNKRRNGRPAADPNPSGPAPVPAVRPRGRPRKNPEKTAPSVAAPSLMPVEAVSPSSTPPGRRPRGRPRRITPTASEAAAPLATPIPAPRPPPSASSKRRKAADLPPAKRSNQRRKSKTD